MFVGDHTEPLGHAWNEGEYIVEPTCAEDGIIEYTCQRCGAAKREIEESGLHSTCLGTLNSVHTTALNAANMLSVKAPAQSQAFNAANSALAAAANTALTSAGATSTEAGGGHVAGSPATCTSPQTCVVCGVILAEATGHRYWQETTQPTCTEMGYTTYTCINCNQSYKSDYVSAPGHNYSEQVTAPTCTSQGYTTYICRKCGDRYVGNYREMTDHVWDKGTEIINAACNGAGLIEYRCANANCDAVRLEAVSALGHTPGESANCTEPQVCTKCGAVLQNARGHRLEEKITAPTCTNIGYTTVTCRDCGLSYKTDYTDCLGHSYKREVTPPFCLERGYATYICASCGDSYDADYTEPAGHKWDSGRTVTESVCNGEGMTEYRCESCGLHRLEAKSALGHTPGAAATCTEPQVCTRCNAILKAAVGHDYVSKITTQTCEEMGYTTFTCKYCGDSYKGEYLDAAGHTPGEWVVDKQPTLTAEGSKHKSCTKCGKVLETEVIERVYNQSVTDGKGEATVGKYLVTVTDTESKNPITGAVVNLNTDNSISVNLPSSRLLDYAAQTTVTVQTKEDLQAVSAMAVAVTDVNKNYSANKTDANGQIVVP